MIVQASSFQLGSPAHLLALLGCAIATACVVVLGRRWREQATALRRLRLAIVVGCLLSWVVSNAYWLRPEVFRWDGALPLQFCNLANLLGAHAVWTGRRWSQALLYYWTFALSTWAFLTPALNEGPATLSFWLFWLYHVFIPISMAYVLVVDRMRPHWGDFRIGVVLTAVYTGALAVLNAFTGWNYGFVGPGMPAQPSPMDLLGPYPLRLIWIGLVGATVFALLTLPWTCCRTKKPDAGEPATPGGPVGT